MNEKTKGIWRRPFGLVFWLVVLGCVSVCVIVPIHLVHEQGLVKEALLFATICSAGIVLAVVLAVLFLRWLCRWQNFRLFLLGLATVVALAALLLPGQVSGQVDSVGKAACYALAQSALVVLAVVLAILFVRWLRRRRNFRRFILGGAFLAALIVLFYAEENWRGKRAWEKFKREWEAKGEKFDLASYAPPPVPDDQNFALTPVVASCYVGRFDQKESEDALPNTNLVNRLKMSLYRESEWTYFPTNLGYWQKGKLSDLSDWQRYYRTTVITNLDYYGEDYLSGDRTNEFPVPPKLVGSNVIVLPQEFPIAPQPQSPAADVLLALSRYDAAIEELRQASSLPYSRFPVNYDAQNPEQILLPHLKSLKDCAEVLRLRIIAELQLGQTEQALADVKLALRLIDSMRSEPFLISHQVRIVMWQLILQPVWEGLAEHRWSDTQLAELDRELRKLDFPSDLQFSMRGERAFALAVVGWQRMQRNDSHISGVFLYSIAPKTCLFLFEKAEDSLPHSIRDLIEHALPLDCLGKVLRRLPPSGWYYRNQRTIGEVFQQRLLRISDPEKHLISPQAAQDVGAVLDAHRARLKPSNALALWLLPGLSPAAWRFAFAQGSADLARVACALERHRLAHGEYPEALDALVPQFIAKLPYDIANGQPLHYHRTDDGRFVLYSVGWNGTDDGGAVGLKQWGRWNMETGDWVWSLPSR